MIFPQCPNKYHRTVGVVSVRSSLRFFASGRGNFQGRRGVFSLCGRVKYEEKVKKLLLNRKKTKKGGENRGEYLTFLRNHVILNLEKFGMISA